MPSVPAGPLLHANWNISNRCELDCEHCYSRPRASDPELDRAGRLAIADNIIGSGVFSVNLGGGEPLLCEDIHPVIERLAQAHVIVSLCTSGLGMDAAMAGRLRAEGLATVYVSIDGATAVKHDMLRGTGSFERAVAAIEACIRVGLDAKVSSTVTAESFDDLDAIVALSAELGASRVEFKRLKPYGNAAGRADLALSDAQEAVLYDNIGLIKRRSPIEVALVYGYDPVPGVDDGCPCGKSVLCIMADGKVAPCVYNPQPVGDALREGLLDIWQGSPALAEFRDKRICAGLDFVLEVD